MDITQLLLKENISFDLALESKVEVLDYLAQQFYESKVVGSKEDFLAAVMYRESLSETGLSDGIAIPHGKDDCVLKASIAFVRLQHPIEWESIDDKPVSYVFLLAIPNKDNTHIVMMSELARSLIRADVIEQVHHAKNADDLLAVF